MQKFRIVKKVIERDHKAVDIYQIEVYKLIEKETYKKFLFIKYEDTTFVKGWSVFLRDPVYLRYVNSYFDGIKLPYFYSEDDAQKYINYMNK